MFSLPHYIKLMILEITQERQFPLKFLKVKRAFSLKIASNLIYSDFIFQFRKLFNIQSGLIHVL